MHELHIKPYIIDLLSLYIKAQSKLFKLSVTAILSK